jgi:type VI secretion system secreted protein Hcp
MKLKVVGVGLVLVVAGTAAAIALAATTITPITVAPKDAAGTVTIPGIQGGDTTGNPPISVLSFSWGVSTNTGVGTANLHELTVTKLIDKASPSLMLTCATGRHIQQVTLVLSRPGAPAGTPFMEYRLGDVSVTSVSHSGSGSDRPLEKVSFQYVSIDQKYTTADGEVVEATFNSTP